MMNGAPIGAVCAFAGQVDPVSADRSDVWNQAGCPSSTPTAGTADPDVPLTHLESQGWMLCDGRYLPVDAYPELFAVLGTLYGEGTNFQQPTFRLPDYRGLFLRGVDAGAGQDPDVKNRKAADGKNATSTGIGSLQCDALQEHTHDYQAVQLATPAQTGSAGAKTASAQATGKPNAPARLSSETRPKNISVNYVIRYR